MKVRLHFGLQVKRDDGLGDPVRNCGALPTPERPALLESFGFERPRATAFLFN